MGGDEGVFQRDISMNALTKRGQNVSLSCGRVFRNIT
jgi:hypothetical protein